MKKPIIERIREYIACPQFGDINYGKWGSLRLDQRVEIKELCDYAKSLEEANVDCVDAVIYYINYIKEKDENMEDYKVRFLKEYKELKEKYEKLHKIIVKAKAGTLDFELSCPLELLEKQANYMGNYLHILEIRAEIEGVDIN